MSAHPNLPDGWQYDPYWQSAAYLLDSLGSRVWTHVTNTGIDYPRMLDEGWSGGQRRIIQAARSMWDGQPVSLLDLAAGLDDRNWQRFLLALAMLRAGLT